MSTLNATDANFLYAETDTCPMSIASVQYMQLPDQVSATDFVTSLQAFLQQRLHLVPYLTSIPQWTDGVIGHPNWVTVPDFDITQHVYSVPVPAPAGRRQVEQIVARLHESTLPRTRPLWDLVVLTGLPNNQVAYYNRVHHACIDGVSAQASTALLMDKEPDQADTKTAIPAGDRHTESAAEHFFNFLAAAATQAVQATTLAPQRMQALGELAQRTLHPTKGLGALTQPVPASVLNGSVDRSRTYAMGEIPLKEAKNLAKSTNSSLNDIFLNICGGALRRYLVRHGACPEQSLIAGCPVSLRQPGDHSNDNQVTMMKVDLGTDVDDTILRLGKVRSSARIAKEVTATMAPLLPRSITLPGLGAMTHNLAEVANYLPLAEWLGNAPFNVLISNVPGPRQVLYSNGARMLTHYPVSIPAHGIGVNITCQSYVDRLYFGVTACARTMPDADLLRDDIEYEWDNLHAALTADVVKLPKSSEDEVAPRPIAPPAATKNVEDNDQQVA